MPLDVLKLPEVTYRVQEPPVPLPDTRMLVTLDSSVVISFLSRTCTIIAARLLISVAILPPDSELDEVAVTTS